MKVPGSSETLFKYVPDYAASYPRREAIFIILCYSILPAGSARWFTYISTLLLCALTLDKIWTSSTADVHTYNKLPHSTISTWGTRWYTWLRHYALDRKEMVRHDHAVCACIRKEMSRQDHAVCACIRKEMARHDHAVCAWIRKEMARQDHAVCACIRKEMSRHDHAVCACIRKEMARHDHSLCAWIQKEMPRHDHAVCACMHSGIHRLDWGQTQRVEIIEFTRRWKLERHWLSAM
jgi:hypothetical protein